MSGVIQLLATYNTATAGYLFDTYAGAFGLSMRRLNTSYAGSCLRVRRSSDQAEQDIGFSGADLDTSSLATFCSGTNGFVTTWYDQSGNGLNVTQTTAGSQPQIVASGTVNTINGKPAMYFDGSDDILTRTAISALAADVALSIFSVCSVASTETIGTIVCNNDGSSNTNSVSMFCDSRSGFQRNGFIITSSGNFAADMSTPRVSTAQRNLSFFVDGSKGMSSFDNGATGGTATYTNSYTNQSLMLGKRSAGFNKLNGYIQEVLVYSSNQSSNRVAIETNVTDYF